MKVGTLFSGIGGAELAWQPMGNYRDLTGYRSGRLVAVRPVGRSNDGHILWECRCECGTNVARPGSHLTATTPTRSCGCLRREAARRRTKVNPAWNSGKTYPIGRGEHIYKTRASWSKAVVRHYGNRCEKCGWREASCDAHHRVPRAKGGLNTISNGIVLCPNHHRLDHEKIRGVEL